MQAHTLGTVADGVAPAATDRLGRAGHVWVRPLARGGELDRLASVLDEDQRRQAAAFITACDRDAYVTAHGLLRNALTWARPAIPARSWRFRRAEHERPELAGPCTDVRFSLSHSACRVAVALCADECGVDVECGERAGDLDLLARTVLSPGELVRFRHVPDGAERRAMFFRLWTLKECYAKARGLGLRLPFNALDIRLDPISLVDTTLARGSSGEWQFAQWADDGHPVAVVFRSEVAGNREIVTHSGQQGDSAERLAHKRRGEIV